MKRRYAELTVRREPAGWSLSECSEDFLEMTGFSRAELHERFQDHFMPMLSTVDMPAADQLFAFPEGTAVLCPWIFTLTCAGRDETLRVLLQVVPQEMGEDVLRVRVHNASFLDEQIGKMGQRIRSLESCISSGLCQVLLDEHFSILWHNDYYLEMLGYTEEQFAAELQCQGRGYINPEDAVTIAHLLGEAMEQGERTLTAEMRITRRDGEIRTLLTSFSFTNETVNGIPVFYSTGIDVTAQKRARELEQDAERMKLAMAQASSYILEYDVLSHTLMASESLQRYFNIGGNVENVPESLIAGGRVAPDSVETLRDLFRRIEAREKRAEGVVCLREEGVADIWFRLRLSPINDDAQRPVKAILLAEDITERYKMEMRYREEEQRRVAMTYDMDFSSQFDLTHGIILAANREKFPFFDFDHSDSSREMIRRNADQYVHPDDRGEYLRKLSIEYMLNQFRQGVPEIKFDFRGADGSGQYHWTRAMVHIIQEPQHGGIYAYIYTKDINEEKEREQDLRRHAEQDALTGIYNRYTVELRCDELLGERTGKGVAVLYMLDLDNFKYLNDTFGHLRGDEMLRQAAACLRDLFGETALLGRIGGDELVAFQWDCPSIQTAEALAQRLCDGVEALEAGSGVITVSVGLAFAPRDGSTFAALYHCADDALYQAKYAGKNRWAVYHEAGSPSQGQERLAVSREWLLEESSDIVYVCDFYSYNLLYMNKGARELFALGDVDYVGHKCYKVLQNRDRPCEFCTNHMLCREQFYRWEFQNPVLGKSLLLRDRIVDWYGTPARIEFATDVSVMERRNQALEEQVQIDHVIISCLRAINGASTMDDAIGNVLRELADFYKADRAFLVDYDARANVLLPRYQWSKPGIRTLEELMGPGGVQPDDRLRSCLMNRENYLLDHVDGVGEDVQPYHKSLYDGGVTCQRCAPTYVNQRPVGMIGLDNPTAFRGEITVLETLGYFISEEVSRSRLSARLTFLSYHDSLTGLWNRNRYMEYVETLRSGRVRTLGVAVADLNALKSINKLRGHAQGDYLVCRAAELLRTCFPGAQIFRLSGDEFVAHSEDLDRFTFLAQVNRMRELSPSLRGHGIAVGHAWTEGEIDCSRLTMQATDIMLMQKREHYQHEREEHGSGKHDHGRLQELMDGLRRGDFQMYLQPKADCAGFQLCGAEALARYYTAKDGLVPPDRFIPVMEEDRVIRYLDLFIFEEVCKLLARWQAEGRELLTISLNFSRQTVLEPDLLNTILGLTDRYQVPKSCIEVEVTETLGEYESSTIAEIGAGIKAAGFRLSLDDFGSHYTNMAMLSAVPADVLKLDKSLVQDVLNSRSNQLVLKSILALCQEMGIESIAEGVETREQFTLLRDLNCDYIQGYLFGRPTTVSEFERQYLV